MDRIDSGVSEFLTTRSSRVVVLRPLAGAAVIVASFWIPVRIFGMTTGAIMGVVLWIGTALMMAS